MKAAESFRLFMFSVHKSLSRRARDNQRRYCSARATSTVSVNDDKTRLREFKTKLWSGPDLTHFIKHSSSNKTKVSEVCEYEEPYLPENSTGTNPRKGEREHAKGR